MSDIVQLPLYASLGGLRLIGADGGAISLPTHTAGDVYRYGLRFFNVDADGNLYETFPAIRTVHVDIGKSLDAPALGSVTLKKSGGTAFGPIAIDSDADTVKAKFNASDLTEECVEVKQEVDAKGNIVPGLWLVRFDADHAVDIEVATNALSPESFARWRAFQEGSLWWHELRFIKAPLARNANGFERVLAQAPQIARITGGGDEDGLSDLDVNEVQSLTLTPGWSGVYVIKRANRQTRELGIQATPDEIANALNAMWKDGLTRFEVTSPETNVAYIRFVGPLKDSPQDLLEIVVKKANPGVVTFDVSFDEAPMHTALRVLSEITTTLEIELEVVDNPEDIENDEVAGRPITIAAQAITIRRKVNWPELETIPVTDYLRPPQPVGYTPYSGDQVLIGNQATYVQAIGNGTAKTFSISHMRGTSNGSIALRENTTGGRFLTPLEYTLTVTSDNEFTLYFPSELTAPTSNQYVFCFTAAGPAGAFQAHTHEIAEITGLEERLAAIEGDVAALQDMAPAVSFVGDASAIGSPEALTLPDRKELFPGFFAPKFDIAAAIATGAGLRGPHILLPAMHDSASESVSLPLGSVSSLSGHVIVNDDTNPITLPASPGRRSQVVKVGEFFTSDGRVFFPVVRSGTTTSYFPREYERTGYVIPVNDPWLRAAQTLTFTFSLSTAMLKATSRMQALAVIEIGTMPSQSSPSTTATNLQDVVWNATPLLVHRVVLGPVVEKVGLGCQIARAANGTDWTATAIRYGKTESAGVAPAAVNFALRARLIQWDTENSVTDARGFIYTAFTDGKVAIADS